MKKIKEKILENRNKILSVLGGMIILLLLAILLPSLFTKSVAQSHYSNIEESKTIKQDQTFWENLWNPKYVIFNQEENKNGQLEARANFTELKRKNLLWWDVETTSVQPILVPETLSSEDQEKVAESSIKDLHEAVEDGIIGEGDNFQYSKDLPQAAIESIKKTQEMNTPGYVLQDFSNNQNDHSIQLTVGLNPDENQVILNGEKIEALQNIENIDFDLEGKNLYYTKYTINEEDELDPRVYDGKIYKFDVATKSEEEIYDFQAEVYISLKANQENIIYAFPSGEVGKINIETREKESTDSLKDKVNINPAEATDFFDLGMVKVTSVGYDEAIITIESEEESVDYRISIPSLEVLEL